MKASLFILIGYIIHLVHAQDTRRFGLSAILHVLYTALLAVVALHVAGYLGTAIGDTKDHFMRTLPLLGYTMPTALMALGSIYWFWFSVAYTVRLLLDALLHYTP